MGFYTKGNFLYLPNKRVVDDLIERDGPPTKESFTPYTGMNYLISEQMKGARFHVLGIDVIKENIKEYLPSRAKATSDDISKSMESDDLTGTTYYYLLEDIDESHLVKYMRSQLIGLKINKSDARSTIEANEKIQPTMYDSESGEVFNLSDVYVSDEYEESNSMLSEVRSKIPYLLKKLQDGSIQYGVSLLSLFIARNGVIEKLGRHLGEIKPRELLAYDIYRVSPTGDLLDTFDKETANNIPKFREPKDLVMGVYPNDPYYKAGIELTIRVKQLGYNLYEENVTDYSPSYINRLMCRYIISNQEVLSDMAAFDPNIMKLFQDGSIFKVAADSTRNSQQLQPVNKVLKLREMARQKMSNVPSLHKICESDQTIIKLLEPVKLINQFLKVYKEFNIKSSMEVETTADCTIDSDTLCDSSGQPLIFRGDAFVLGFRDTPLFGSVYFIVTNLGYIVGIDSNLTTVTISTVKDAIMYKATGDRDNFLRKEYNI